jgi:hypothetical protein
MDLQQAWSEAVESGFRCREASVEAEERGAMDVAHAYEREAQVWERKADRLAYRLLSD